MSIDRPRLMALVVALLVLSLVLYRAWGTTSVAPGSSSNSRARAGRSARAEAPAATAPEVRLESLSDERPQPVGSDRNLFRFKPTAPPPGPAPLLPPVETATPVAPRPTGPPPPPPIPLKFIGIVEAPGQSKRIAALIDATGKPFGGGEGDVVAGQYRILKIGVESIEIAYLDGRGQQTIRLSGS